MSEPKYAIRSDGRIVALRNFGDIREGDVGGFIDTEFNLSHNGSCWVADDAWAGNGASVRQCARVGGNARVGGSALVTGVAQIGGNARVSGTVTICGIATVCDGARVDGCAAVGESAYVGGDVRVDGRVTIKGMAQLLRREHCMEIGSTPWGSLWLIHTRDGSGVFAVGCQQFELDRPWHDVANDAEEEIPAWALPLEGPIRAYARAIEAAWKFLDSEAPKASPKG